MARLALLILLGVIVLFVGVGFLLPSEYRVSVEGVVPVPPEEVHEVVADLGTWPGWLWRHPEETAEGVTFEVGSPSAGVGASLRRIDGEQVLELTLESAPEGEGVEYTWALGDLDRQGRISLEGIETGTRLVWSEYADLGGNPFWSWVIAMGVLQDAMRQELQAALTRLRARCKEAPAAGGDEGSGKDR